MKKTFLPLLVALATVATPASAAISLTSSTAFWTPITYANPNAADPSGDQQTGTIEGDIVGNASNPSFYTNFYDGGTAGDLTDGEIAFRIRLGGDANPAGLKTVIWVGIDGNGDGKMDLFAGALEDSKIGYYPAGTGANISPSTTSINSSSPFFEVAVTTLNFNFSPVTAINDPTATSFNLDGGSGGGANHTDHFVSFKLSFASLVSAMNGLNLAGVGTSFDQNTPLRFIAATSQQANALNQDLNGVTGGVNSTSTWTDLGGFSNTITASGVPVPEPSSAGFLVTLGLLAGLRRRRQG